MSVSEEMQEQFMKEGEADKHSKKGVKLIHQEKYDEAISELVKASQKHPENWYVWYHLGTLYRRLILMDEALDAFQKAASLENMTAYYRNAASIQLIMVKFVLEGISDALQLADMLMKHEEYEYAIRAMNIALRKMPELDRMSAEIADIMGSKQMWSVVLQHKALCLTQLGRIGEAKDVYEHIIQIDSNVHSVYIALGACLFGLGEKERALSILEKGMELEPEDAEGWFLFGDLLIRTRRYEDAIEKIRKGLEIESNNPIALYNIARALLVLGRRKEALDAIEGAFTLDGGLRQKARTVIEFRILENDPDFWKLLII